MARQWFVVETAARGERKAIAELRMQGFLVYAPVYSVRVSHAGKAQLVERFLFPGYAFVAFDPDPKLGMLTAVRRTDGVFGLVGMRNGSRPTPVSDSLMREIAIECALGTFDDLGRARGGVPDFSTGDEVRVTDGPFASFIGKIRSGDGAARIEVLLQVFGRATSVAMGLDQIEKVGAVCARR